MDRQFEILHYNLLEIWCNIQDEKNGDLVSDISDLVCTAFWYGIYKFQLFPYTKPSLLFSII